MKQVLTIFTFVIFAVLLSTAIHAEPKVDATDSAEAKIDTELDSTASQSSDKVVAYYFHSNRRCATCKKLESYAAEAITDGFTDQIEQGQLEWRVVNFESEGNEHIAKDYKLISQSVILSRVVDGKEVKWENLDKIWALVGDKEKFITYVRAKTEKFINSQEK